jgi:hypothetical protein
MKQTMIRIPALSQIRIYVGGLMAVIYLGKLIALVDQKGRILFLEDGYSTLLVHVLIIDYHRSSVAMWN